MVFEFLQTLKTGGNYYTVFLYNTLYLNLFNHQYITGTITSVKKVAKVSPKMIAHDIGFQKTLLSPPT